MSPVTWTVKPSVAQVHKFCAALPEEVRVDGVLHGVLPKLHSLVVDDAQHVRCAVASVIMGLASLIGAEHTITFLLPLFLQLIRDDHSEVQLNMISNLEAINEVRSPAPVPTVVRVGFSPVRSLVSNKNNNSKKHEVDSCHGVPQVIGIDQLAQALEPAINELLANESWRVRLATTELLPLVSTQLGVEYCQAQLLDKCLGALTDSVFCVRSAAVEVVRKLTEDFGPEWSKETLIPRVMAIATDGGT